MLHLALTAVRRRPADLLGVIVVAVFTAGLLTGVGTWFQAGITAGATDLTTAAGSVGGTATVIAVLLLGGAFSAALRHRTPQFALLRTVGATDGQIRTLVAFEILLVVAVATPLGGIPALFLAALAVPVVAGTGAVPAGFEQALGPIPLLAAAAALLLAGAIAGIGAGRAVLTSSAADAASSRSVEPACLSPIRLIAAAVVAAGGLAAATAPVYLPGTAGIAAAGSSVLLFVIAVVLAGPALIAAAARLLERLTSRSSSGSAQLAVINARGFSRRFSAAVVPLVLLLAFGTVQSSIGTVTLDAAREQLTRSLGSDLVATVPGADTGRALAAARSTSGVTGATATWAVPADIAIGPADPDLPALDALSWSSGSVTAVDPHAARTAETLNVTTGGLARLQDRGSVAVSSDMLLGEEAGLGDPVRLRWADGTTTTLTIAAVYEPDAAAGDFLVDARHLPATAATTATLLVGLADSSSSDAVRANLRQQGLQIMNANEYLQQVLRSAEGQQRLSLLALLLLLGYTAITAATTLITGTGRRRAEFALLQRTGATRTQILQITLLESGLIVGVAVLTAAIATLPGLVAAHSAALHHVGLTLDGPVTAALTSLTVLIAPICIGLSTRNATRSTTTRA